METGADGLEIGVEPWAGGGLGGGSKWKMMWCDAKVLLGFGGKDEI